MAPLHGGPGAGICTGKGRGGQASGKSLGLFETPPAKVDGHGDDVGPKRTQGRMPMGGGAALGKPMDSSGKSPEDGPNDSSLQRALEMEIVNHLRAQNSQLLEELDRMKTLMSQAGNGSNSSWSEVGGASACAGIPPETTDDGGQRRGVFRHPKVL